MIWVDLLVAAVTEQAPLAVDTGFDADALVLEEGTGLELAEVLSGIAAALEDWLPTTDAALLGVVARDGVQVTNLSERGLLVVKPDRGLGFTLGRGQVVESAGESLAVIQAVEASRFIRGYRLPGYKYWGA